MDNPLTQKEFKEGLKDLKQGLVLDFSKGPSKHPIAFVTMVVLIIVAFGLWTSIFNSLMKKYFKESETLGGQIIMAVIITILAFYVLKHYNFTLTNIEAA